MISFIGAAPTFQKMSFSTLFFSTSGMVFLIVTLKKLWKRGGVKVDHSTLNLWVIQYSFTLALAAKKLKRAVASSWRMDETYQSRHG